MYDFKYELTLTVTLSVMLILLIVNAGWAVLALDGRAVICGLVLCIAYMSGA